jgi:hypothetical protein
MADIRVPPNVSSVTFATAGVKAPTANIITGIGAAETTDVTSPYSWGPGNPGVVTSNVSTGAVDMYIPTSITSITINGNVKAVSGGKITGVAAADAAAFYFGSEQRKSCFELVSS